MRTISVIARKGGSGKTTMAVQLALTAHRRGWKTLLADTDPQHSALEALRQRSEPGPAFADTSGAKLFPLQVAALRRGVQLLVIDTAAAEQALAHAIVVSDLSLLVVRPTFLDLAAAARTADVVRRLSRPMLAVLNQAPPAREGVEPPLVRLAIRGLAAAGIPAAPAMIRARSVYQSAMARGLSVEEGADASAAREIGELWDVVREAAAGVR